MCFSPSSVLFKIIEGYGQTEATAANIIKSTNCHICGTVGIPFPTNMLKFKKYEDFNGINEGEILLKGNNVFKGYYNNEEKTKAVIDKDGWLSTGDIGIERDGNFEIVGRMKDMFKTSLGEFIVPEKLEKIFKPCVSDIFITGHVYGDYIVAIVHPKGNDDKKTVLRKIKEKGNVLVEQGHIARFEIPKDIHITEKGFDDLNLLTPSAKKMRKEIRKFFKNEIDKMFSEN